MCTNLSDFVNHFDYFSKSLVLLNVENIPFGLSDSLLNHDEFQLQALLARSRFAGLLSTPLDSARIGELATATANLMKDKEDDTCVIKYPLLSI